MASGICANEILYFFIGKIYSVDGSELTSAFSMLN